MTTPEFGARGRYYLDPAVRDIVRRIRRDGFIRASTMGQMCDDGEDVEHRDNSPEYLVPGMDPDELVALSGTGGRFHRLIEAYDYRGRPYPRTVCGVYAVRTAPVSVVVEEHYGPCRQCWSHVSYVPLPY